jgi:hypothetical protein
MTTWATIRPDGVVECHDGEPTLELWKGAIGGQVEQIIVHDPLPPIAGLVVLANEDGRALGMTPNRAASALCGVDLCGNVILAGPVRRGDTTPLPEGADTFLRAAARMILEVHP